MQKSIILKTLILDGQISLAVLDTTSYVNEVIRRHALSPVAAAAFGRTATACAYLCSWLKNDASLSVTVKGDGVGGKICVEGGDSLNLCGFVEDGQMNLPLRADGKLDVGGFVGRHGTLTVVRDDGEGIPIVGTSELVSGEIAEDFSAYFLTSEQRPTAIALGVQIGADGNCLGAGGVFLQPLPGAGEEAISFCEREIGRFSSVSSLIREKGAEGVLRMLAEGDYTERPISFRCRCSKERAGSAILSLGRADAEALLAEQGQIVVHCHFCNTDHIFTRAETEALFWSGS